jgi:pilus assembly protein CpaF
VSREAVHSQASAAVRVALHLARDESGCRRLESIAVLRRKVNNGPLQVSLAVSFDGQGRGREWPGLDQLESELGRGRYGMLPLERGSGRRNGSEYAQAAAAAARRERTPWVPQPREAEQ